MATSDRAPIVLLVDDGHRHCAAYARSLRAYGWHLVVAPPSRLGAHVAAALPDLAIVLSQDATGGDVAIGLRIKRLRHMKGRPVIVVAEAPDGDDAGPDASREGIVSAVSRLIRVAEAALAALGARETASGDAWN